MTGGFLQSKTAIQNSSTRRFQRQFAVAAKENVPCGISQRKTKYISVLVCVSEGVNGILGGIHVLVEDNFMVRCISSSAVLLGSHVDGYFCDVTQYMQAYKNCRIQETTNLIYFILIV